jgi:hypothetical protein
MMVEGEAAVEMDVPSTWLQLKVEVHMPLLLSQMTPPISSNQYPLSNIASPNNKSENVTIILKEKMFWIYQRSHLLSRIKEKFDIIVEERNGYQLISICCQVKRSFI